MSGRFNGDRMAVRRLAADMAEQFEMDAKKAGRTHEFKQQRRRATKEYYAEQRGSTMIFVSLAVIFFGVLLLWINECAQREKADLKLAINTLRNNGNNIDDLKDEHILRAVLDAERRVNRSLLFAVACRVVTDSFAVSGMASYESTFRKALESALQQHMFLLVISVTVVVCFFLSVVMLFYLTCTRKLWVGSRVPTRLEQELEDKAD